MNKKYDIIYADPPWTYRDKALAGNRGAGCKYNLMTEAQLVVLPVPSITADNCALFMWVTMPKLPDAINLMKALGFEYKTCAFTWVKRNKIAPSWFFGMGNWTRSNAELCLLGVRGSPKRISASVSQIIDTPIEAHSKKPGVVRDRIVELMGDLPRVELFARESSSGWDVFGDEVAGSISF